MSSKLSIYHGPINIAGIASELSRLENEKGLDSNLCTYFRNPLVHENEQSLNLQDKSFLVQPFLIIGYFFYAIFRFNTFHFYFGLSLLPFNLDLPILRLFGKKVIMTYCGSEIRLMELVEKNRNKYYHLLKHTGNFKENELRIEKFTRWFKSLYSFRYSHPYYDNRKIGMMKFQNMFIKKFIAIRDNYASANFVIPANKIVSNLLINNITVEAPLPFKEEKGDQIKIVHAPSNVGLKGTEFIESAIEDLKKEHLSFEYFRLENLPFEEAKKVLKHEATIVIDQLLIGSIGSVTIEAMSYGKPIICYVLDEIISEHCPDLPVHNANPDNIKEKLKELIINPDLRRELGNKGFEFISKHYDKNQMLDKLIDLYRSL